MAINATYIFYERRASVWYGRPLGNFIQFPESRIPSSSALSTLGSLYASRLPADQDPATQRMKAMAVFLQVVWPAMLPGCRRLGRIQKHLHRERRGIHAGAAGAEASWPSLFPLCSIREATDMNMQFFVAACLYDTCHLIHHRESYLHRRLTMAGRVSTSETGSHPTRARHLFVRVRIS